MRDRYSTKEQLLNELAELRQQITELERSQTQLREAEEAARQSEEHLRFALEIIHAGAWDLDLVDHSAFRSLEHDRIFGYAQLLPEWTYEMFLEHVLPEDRSIVDGEFQRAVENESDWNFECRIRRTDGQVRWIWAAGRHTQDAAGARRRMTGIVQDITERKRMEQELQQSERLYRAIGESINYGVWVCAPDGRNIYASESFLKMVGLTQEECSSFGWGNVLHPDDAERTIAAWQECVRTEGVWDIEHRFRGVDGEYHHVLARGIPVRDDQGQITCWAGINLDIDHLKQMQEDLRRSRDELELRVQERTTQLRRQAELLDLAHDAVILRDMEGRIAFWNNGAEDTYGFMREEAIGRFVHTLLQTKFDTPLNDIVDRVNRDGRWEGELIQTCKEGKQVIVHSRWALRHDEVSGSTEVMEVNRDITMRKQAEEALSMMSEYNRSLIEASVDPLVTINPEGRITDVNTATERVTGYSRDSLIGTDFFDYFTDPKKAKAGYQLVFKEGFVRDYELEIRHKDGQLTPVLYNASVYRDRAGKVIGIFAAARDITAQRLLEEQLRQAQKLEAIGTLSGGIAHDFNNILQAIISSTETVIDDVSDNAYVQHKMDQVLKAAFRARDLVRQILTFSRRSETEKKALHLSPLIQETFKLLRASIPTTIEMKLDLDASRDLVYADPSQIQQIIMNLCTNAAQAMREKGGTLEVSLRAITIDSRELLPEPDMAMGEYLVLSVRDTGHGMDDAVMKRMFEPFFTTKEKGQGTGLGLSVVYGIVKSHKGGMRVWSKPGHGSVLTVYLPLASVSAEVQSETVSWESLLKGTERILFVDDEEVIRELGQAVLARLGYTVVAKRSSKEALEIFMEDPKRFDLVITDQTMPGMTGVMLAAELLKLRPDLPVILCTGYSESVSREAAQEVGITEFVMKPLSKRELAQAVRRALESKK